VVHAFRRYAADARVEVARWQHNFRLLPPHQRALLAPTQPAKAEAALRAIEVNQFFFNAMLSAFDPPSTSPEAPSSPPSVPSSGKDQEAQVEIDSSSGAGQQQGSAGKSQRDCRSQGQLQQRRSKRGKKGRKAGRGVGGELAGAPSLKPQGAPGQPGKATDEAPASPLNQAVTEEGTEGDPDSSCATGVEGVNGRRDVEDGVDGAGPPAMLRGANAAADALGDLGFSERVPGDSEKVVCVCSDKVMCVFAFVPVCTVIE
jgi:hypothetical protein